MLARYRSHRHDGQNFSPSREHPAQPAVGSRHSDLELSPGVNNLLTLRLHANSTDIHNRIGAAFRRSSELDAGRVHIEVTGGNVTLSGELSNWTEIGAAGLAAWNAPGVTTVDNQIRIGV